MDGGGYKITPTIKGSLKPVQNRVLVSHMHFGEQKTAGGLIIRSDDGETRGIYPRWGKVYSKGPKNIDDYKVGEWILIEHGRWTRGLKVDTEHDGEITFHMVDETGILAYSNDKQKDLRIGAEHGDGDIATIDPGSFINPNA